MLSRWIFTVWTIDKVPSLAIMKLEPRPGFTDSGLSFATDDHGRTQDSGFWIKRAFVVLRALFVL